MNVCVCVCVCIYIYIYILIYIYIYYTYIYIISVCNYFTNNTECNYSENIKTDHFVG